MLDLLGSRQRFLLSGHEHPDGDCLGSQVGLFHLLETLGAEVSIYNPDPVLPSLAFLGEQTPIRNHAHHPVPSADVVILLDCAELSRLGSLAAELRRQSPRIAVIDHHVGSEHGDGSVCLVDTTAAATGVLVYELYEHFGVEVGPAAAEGLFVSLVADTGWFRYSNTDPRTLAIAAQLVEAGAAPDKLYDRLYRGTDPRSLGLLSESLARHQLRLGGRFGFTVFDQQLMQRVGDAGFDTDTVLEAIRSVRGIEVAALFKSIHDGVKLSLRSMGRVDVQRIAARFGGGGHTKASGATIRLPVAAAVAEVEQAVAEALAALPGEPSGR
ncbi:MAG: bifunctional oligoribonuclease/PAP phosphatase NrnA [Planctomycetes bacterium]|nr:bifunctional oligoribonuclease/PAP phosphatase NrnA [Planctomycetota bacterium]MCB9869650.1 bifunctional oligoribonuclease/PAP phosphatase NrnA [Planctomycetota bacterium]